LPLPADAIESYVLDFCKRLLKDPVAVYNYQKQIPSQKLDFERLAYRESELIKLIDSFPIRKANLREQHELGAIDLKTLKKKLGERDQEEKDLRQELRNILVQKAENTLSRDYLDSFDMFARKYGSRMDSLMSDREAIYTLFHHLIEEIVIYSRPRIPTDVIAGQKKSDQSVPHRIHIKFKLPKDIMQQIAKASSGYKSLSGAG